MESEVAELSAPQSPSPMEGLESPPEPVAGDDEEVAVAEHALSGEDIPMEEAVQMSEDEDEAEPPVVAVSVVEKRRRGRPPKARGGARAPVARRKEKEEESVCFICFENGNLVGCNRRGCTKVYHPLCVNRDESYFRSRGRWNCGWHICSDCEKAAHFMCYTCTYSLCKACNRGAKFICIRGNKGFCETCYETVMLIESNEHNAGEELQDSFSDKTSWHYLFKMYWLELNEKLSLTFNELSAPQTQRKRSTAVAYKDDSSDESYHVNDDQETSSDSSAEQYGRKNSAKKKHRRSSRNAPEEERLIQQVDNGGRTSAADDTKWASKELLEFVAHMKDGDTSPLSQFDVQALILAYIKKNNLRDPRKKSQSICDPMLQKIFQKERVGHFEMLKLLESHFLTKEVSQVITDNTHGRGLDLDSGLMDDEGYSDGAAKFGSDKKRKTRKKVEEREPQTNLDDYAAIDVYNISLMYLRRSLMEDLLDDIDSFSEKVIGSFVRIRIPATDKKQDMYRLVQIVGTHVGAENYKIGKKMTDIRLEILNLDKTEAVTIDTISNQEFSEEECRRLRQSIKCGLINRLTVGQVQEKARVLQAVRVDDCLESEKQRLGNLRDRASEQGRRKQLRECVEKIQLLNTDEERWRRLNDVPEIHADPKMNPEYESTDEEPDDKSQDNFNRSREPFSLRKGQHLFPGNGGHVPSSNWNGAHKSSNTHLEVKKSASVEAARDKVDPFNSVLDRASEYLSPQGKGCATLNDKASEYQSSQGKGWGTPNVEANPVGMDRASGYSPQGKGWAPSNTQANPADMEAGGWKNNNQHTAIPAQSYGVPLETVAATLSTGISLPPINNETEKMWYYQDPSGKIHGPFSMLQLRKWNTTGYFPTELKIWRTHGNQDDYVLLSDALIGKFQKVPEPQHNSFPPQPMNFATPMAIENTNPSWVTSNQIPGNWNPVQNNAIFSGSDIPELGNPARWQNQTVAWSIPRSEVANPMGGSIGPIGWEAPRDVNTWPIQAQVQAHSGFRPTAPAQSGFTPTATDYSGFRPSAQDNGVFRPTAPDHSGFRPTAPDHAGFRPTAPDHSGFRPTASAHGGFRPTDPFSENNYQPSAHQGRGGRGGRWNRGPDRGSSWNIPNRLGGLRPNGQGFERRQSNWNSSGQQSYGGPWKAQPANDPFNPSSPTPQPARGGWPNKDETANLGGGISSPKQSGKKQGWGSWSASPSMPDKAKKADGWGSWSPVSSPKREKAEVAEAFDASSSWSCQSNASVLTEGSGASNKNQFLQDECPSPTPLCERQKLPVAHHDEHSAASITIPAPEALSTGANKKATVGPDLAQRIGVSSDRWDTPGGECSLPSPTPTTRSPNPWVSSPPRRGTVTESTQPEDSGWDHLVPPQDPSEGTGTANTGWGSKSSKGWGGSSQGSMNVNAGWGRPENDNTANLNMSWEVPAQGNPVQNPGPGNSNKNNWGAPVQQGNDGWVSGHGNQSSWGGGVGNGLGNNRVQPGGGRGPPRPPPRGQGQEPGICKFHESGFCKKGARCNYRHT